MTIAHSRPSWWRDLRPDLIAATAVTFLAVPQGIAYAMIAGLPPAVGLYASALPVIVGSLTRSSSHVVTGPTNALSLLVGGATLVATADDPAAMAALLAFLVGVFQVAAGALRLGALVDYISSAVVLGYVAGAGVLIGVGQLPNLTGTTRTRGHIVAEVSGWLTGLGDTHLPTLIIAAATVAALVAIKRWAPRIPGAIVVLSGGVILSYVVDLQAMGVQLARDIAPVPAGFPPLTLPDLGAADLGAVVPVAFAAMVLSLVESSAVARSIAGRSGQRLDANREFLGQGLANVVAGLFGGYPTSGSLARSALNERVGARTRAAGVLSGVMMVGVLLALGSVVDRIPVPSLAGLLVVVAAGLVDVPRIVKVFRSGWGDRLAFSGTLIGAWTLSIDQAIYVGVGLSIALFLRWSRNLVITDLRLVNGRLQETPDRSVGWMSPAIRILQVEGALFFGAANELRDALDDATRDPTVRVLIVRIKRTQGLDFTTVAVIEEVALRLAAQDRELLLVGMRDGAMDVLESSGAADVIGEANLYPTQPGWFVAMDQALRHARDVTRDLADTSPLDAYLARRGGLPVDGEG